jgi:NAD(P)-dependent dehydrogenase (short-subunit alcohol dehydrogenase family)
VAFENLSFDFSGRSALVVGGSRGIGRGVALALAEAGARTFYASRRPMDGEPRDVEHLPCDITDEDRVRTMFATLEELGGPDFMINSAAINFAKKIEDVPFEEWRNVMRVNLDAAFLLCKESLAGMKGRGFGRIVNVSSIAGRHRSVVSGVHYVSSKAGMIGLTKQLAYEAAPFGVTVNAVAPSQTMTDMLRQSMTDEQVENLEANIPLGRIASVDEQVGPILFLLTDAAAYMTGTFLDVNGGQI